MFGFLLVVLFATFGVAIGGWFRPPPNKPSPPPTYTDQQVADAKVDVCAAYHEVRQALAIAGSRNGGGDPTASLAVATSSRQALDVGSRYLLNKLADEPAANVELTKAVRNLANVYLELTVSYLANANDSKIEQLRRSAEQPTSTIDDLCK
jgi:hypothetical protein